jgi:hypothetical protein
MSSVASKAIATITVPTISILDSKRVTNCIKISTTRAISLVNT